MSSDPAAADAITVINKLLAELETCRAVTTLCCEKKTHAPEDGGITQALVAAARQAAFEECAATHAPEGGRLNAHSLAKEEIERLRAEMLLEGDDEMNAQINVLCDMALEALAQRIASLARTPAPEERASCQYSTPGLGVCRFMLEACERGDYKIEGLLPQRDGTAKYCEHGWDTRLECGKCLEARREPQERR